MTNPGDLLDAIVLAVRTIGPLIENHFNGDDSAIFAYRDAYPTQSSLLTALQNAPRPSILWAYMGMVPGDLGSNEVDKHKFTGYIHAAEGAETQYGYFDVIESLVNGLPGTSESPFRYSTIHESCFPPEKITTKRVMSEIDFWEISFLLTEIGG